MLPDILNEAAPLISSHDTYHWLNVTDSWSAAFFFPPTSVKKKKKNCISQRYWITVSPSCRVVTQSHGRTYSSRNWHWHCISECSWWFVCVLVIVWCHHCTNWVLLHIQGHKKLFTVRLGNPPVKRKYKRPTLRNAVGKHTCIQQHNELVSLLGLLQCLFWQQAGCFNKLDVSYNGGPQVTYVHDPST